jgi:hypothetical protein
VCVAGLVGDDADGSYNGGPGSGSGFVRNSGGCVDVSFVGGSAYGAGEAGWGEEVQEDLPYADPQRHRFCSQGRSESRPRQHHPPEAEEKGRFGS